MAMRTFRLLFPLLLATVLSSHAVARANDIGVYYFPGWHSKSDYWNDLKGLAGSRSPGTAWPDREPLLGFYYPEEEVRVAEKHIEWAVQYGITFFIHEFFWHGQKSSLEHALKAHVRAKNKSKMRFCLFWANQPPVPRNADEFRGLVDYWLREYFPDRTYYRIDDLPVVFIFDPDTLTYSAKQFNATPRQLLDMANEMARGKGYKGIYFVAVTARQPSDEVEGKYAGQGYRAYTAYSYVAARDTSQYASYDSMVATYLDFYSSAAKTKHTLPYLVPASPGYDGRPWMSVRPKIHVRTDPTPEKFVRMLSGARALLESPGIQPKVLVIEAWNEFAEGSYIEPTKKWGMRYLEAIQDVFGR